MISLLTKRFWHLYAILAGILWIVLAFNTSDRSIFVTASIIIVSASLPYIALLSIHPLQQRKNTWGTITAFLFMLLSLLLRLTTHIDTSIYTFPLAVLGFMLGHLLYEITTRRPIHPSLHQHPPLTNPQHELTEQRSTPFQPW